MNDMIKYTNIKYFFIAIVIKIDYNWENYLALTMTDQ